MTVTHAGWGYSSFADAYSQLSLQNATPSKAPPQLCPFWSPSTDPTQGYGAIIVYPAKQVQPACHEDVTEQQDTAYTCRLDPATGMPVIDNFWSTSAIDENTEQPLARLLVDVLVLDDMGQPVSNGRQLCSD